MGGHVGRVGGAVLAVLTIAGGGLGLGVGTAGAGLGSSKYGQPLCSNVDSGVLCDGERFGSTTWVGDTELTYSGTDRAAPGDETSFRVSFIGSRDVLHPMVVTSLTHQVPSGFEFTGATVKTGGNRELDPGVVVDPATGNVTVMAPDGGWTIPKDNTSSGYLVFELDYTVTDVDGDSTSRIAFTGTDSASARWVATGNTQGYRDFKEGPFGSTSYGEPFGS
ncbi:hypothetical protein SAMN05444583_11295 [Rhodococcus maanshanensis]|uniref:Uncharacterized protein n=1 Tax=Rhodococcus maanshanensis TaxID=183556 RepID=A0A1H7S2F6_9NOCA|nr:hypothetical protein SAMN05444583_11295 [Rhodococcus maanshanensis]